MDYSLYFSTFLTMAFANDSSRTSARCSRWLGQKIQKRIARDGRDISIKEFNSRRACINEEGLPVQLQLPPIEEDTDFLCVKIKILDLRAHLGSQKWLEKNHDYEYHITLGRKSDFLREELETTWKNLQQCMNNKCGKLYGKFNMDAECAFFEINRKNSSGLNEFILHPHVLWLHTESDHKHRSGWVELHISM